MNAPAFRLARATGRVSPARFVRSPNCDARPADAGIEALVIHAISLPPGCYGGDHIERLFTNLLSAADIDDTEPPPRVSAHFLIRRDGELIQFVPTHLRAWHAGVSALRGRPRVNDFSVGIELEGCDHDRFEEAQYRVLCALARCLTEAYPAISPDHIVGHSDIAPGRKTDPGPRFDWRRFRADTARAA